MNTRLKKTFGFYSGLVFQDRFMVNHYQLECSMLTVTGDNLAQNTAYGRMKYWVNACMDDSILISSANPNLADYQNLNQKIIILPDEPVDQIIGIMLYLKLNAVMENRMVVTDTEICSTQGDMMTYVHSSNETIGCNLTNDGWWVDPRPIWTMSKRQDTKNKVVTLDRLPEWSDHELGWDQQRDQQDSVIFAEFPDYDHK